MMIKTKLALAALAIGATGTASANILVLSSGGPTARRHYPPGSRLPDATVFALRPGDTLSVLWGGSTRSFRGPGAFSVTVPATPFTLLDGRQVRIQTGVVRAPMPQPGVEPTSIWQLDSRTTGTLCIRAGETPVLWRPAGPAAQRVTIRTVAGAAASANWDAGATDLAWPATLPVTDGAAFTLTKGVRTVRVTLRVLPAGVDADIDSLSDALVSRGCQGQVATLIATRSAPAAPVAQDAPAGQR